MAESMMFQMSFKKQCIKNMQLLASIHLGDVWRKETILGTGRQLQSRKTAPWEFNHSDCMSCNARHWLFNSSHFTTLKLRQGVGSSLLSGGYTTFPPHYLQLYHYQGTD